MAKTTHQLLAIASSKGGRETLKVAPGKFYMEIIRNGAFYHMKLHQQPLLHGIRSAADFLMKSFGKYVGANAIGVVLAGMGKNGVEGLLEMKKSGALAISQSENA